MQGQYFRNVIRIITETGLRVYKELNSTRKIQVDLQNAVVWIPDSKTPHGTTEAFFIFYCTIFGHGEFDLLLYVNVARSV